MNEQLYKVVIYGLDRHNNILHIAKATQPLSEANEIIETHSVELFEGQQHFSSLSRTLASITKV